MELSVWINNIWILGLFLLMEIALRFLSGDLKIRAKGVKYNVGSIGSGKVKDEEELTEDNNDSSIQG